MTRSAYHHAMRCPRCGLENPPGSVRCDCGYNFQTKTVQQPAADLLFRALPDDFQSSTWMRRGWMALGAAVVPFLLAAFSWLRGDFLWGNNQSASLLALLVVIGTLLAVAGVACLCKGVIVRYRS